MNHSKAGGRLLGKIALTGGVVFSRPGSQIGKRMRRGCLTDFGNAIGPPGTRSGQSDSLVLFRILPVFGSETISRRREKMPCIHPIFTVNKPASSGHQSLGVS